MKFVDEPIHKPRNLPRVLVICTKVYRYDNGVYDAELMVQLFKLSRLKDIKAG